MSALKSYTDTGFNGSATRYYAVTAKNSSNVSSVYSNMITVPATPTGITIGRTPGRITLAWTAVTGAASYKVYKSTTSGTETFYANSPTINFQDGTSSDTTVYYYKISAITTDGLEGRLSGEITVNSMLPTNFHGNWDGTNVYLTWTAAAGATSYNIYRSGPYNTYNSNDALNAKTKINSTTSTAYTDGSCTTWKFYWFDITAVNASGETVHTSSVYGAPGTMGIPI